MMTQSSFLDEPPEERRAPEGGGGPIGPYARGSETSREAAYLSSVAGSQGAALRRVWEYLKGRKDTGATDEEGQQALRMEGNTYRPRRVDLQRQGLVVDSGYTRLTVRRRRAAVYMAREHSPRHQIPVR